MKWIANIRFEEEERREMKVLLYSGGRQLVKESGVGRALSHQEQALSYGNVDFTENTKDDYDIVHINTVLPDAWPWR